ncbi:MAG: threonine--tRNA ligase [Candidatus Andersenbacteria bacterium]
MAKTKVSKQQAEHNQLFRIRHSAAHLLAAAVLRLYPGSKLGTGPATEEGFFYDILTPRPLTDADLPKLEKEMKKLISGAHPFTCELLSIDEATKKFSQAKQPYKVELIEGLAKEGHKKVSVYKTGNVFEDLCEGPHVDKANEVGAFKLLSVAGAYWKGDESQPQMSRIHGTAFATKKELEEFLKLREEAKTRDHRKLGKDLELFSIIPEIGPGLPLFYPKGAVLRRTLENYVTELQERRGYVPIWIPHVTKEQLYKISGHLDKYDALYPPMQLKGESNYYLKPMNCPHFMLLYKTLPHSYKELPIRWTCTTTNYRYEKSGELTGLTRVRSITQDDCHVFVAPDQIESEITRMLDMVDELYKKFGFKDFWVRISTRDPKDKTKYIGDAKVWDESEAILENVIKKRGWRHEMGVGEAAFYGPKLDFIFKDVLGRPWQLSTIQLDMNLPERFTLEYTANDGSKKQPVVIHRAILGSTERFMGILIEHFAGAFPLWLSPVQVLVLPISAKQAKEAEKIAAQLRAEGLRVEVSAEDETIGRRIRKAEQQKVPYTVVIGDKELAAKKIAVRARGKGDLGQKTLDAFVSGLKKELAS